MLDGKYKIPGLQISLGGRIYLTLYWYLYLQYKISKDATYEETVEFLDDSLKVMSWLFANITYTSDKKPEDHWQEARVTFKRKKGDCEDWAIFAKKCLSKSVDGYYLCIYTKKKGHATYLMKIKKDRWSTLGTFGWNFFTGSLDDVARFFFLNWHHWVLYDEDQEVIKEKER